MTPEHESTYELIAKLHALDTAATEIAVGPVVVRYARAQLVPVLEPVGKPVAELEAEILSLRMRLNQLAPDENLY